MAAIAQSAGAIAYLHISISSTYGIVLYLSEVEGGWIEKFLLSYIAVSS